MWNRGRVLVVALASLLAILPAGVSGSRVSVLLLSGSNNHDWRATTPVLVEILAGAGFVVQVEEHVAGLGPASLAGRTVVVSNFNAFGQKDPGPIWGPEMRAAFLRFIRAGGGFVGVHAGGSVFDDWPEFKRLAGGWWGPQTAHGAIHENAVTLFATGHPLTEGLDSFRTTDEFWQHTSLSPGAVVLAVVVPDPAHGGSGRPEPVLLTTTMARGRGVALLLGHDVRAMQHPGFERLLVGSVTWAATGRGAPSSNPASPANP